jgi:hypothetical protein
MLRPKLVKIGTFGGAGYISSVMVVLVFGFSHPGFSAESTASTDKPHWQLAPIYFDHTVGGNLGYFYQRTSYGDFKNNSQTLGLAVFATGRLTSFFWQPWLALVTADLKGSALNTNTKSNTSSGHSVAKSYGGDAALKMLRYSRFPFEAHLFRHDDSTSYYFNDTSTDNLYTGYSLLQSYKTRNEHTKGSMSFRRTNNYQGQDIGASRRNQFRYDLMVRPTRTQTITINGDNDLVKYRDTGESDSRDNLTANHVYQPNDIFSIASFANQLIRNQTFTTQGSGLTGYDVNTIQFNSFASLRPSRSPLTMTSSVRFLRLDVTSNNIASPTDRVSNFNLGANYLFSPLVRMYGSVNVADDNGLQTTTTNGALTAQKPFVVANATDINGFRYDGSVGGTVSTSNITHTDASNQTTSSNAVNLGLYLSHALNKDIALSGGRFHENLHQTLSWGTSSQSNTPTYTRLQTGGSLGWTRSEGKASTQIRLSAADSRSLSGYKQNAFQMVNLAATRNEILSRSQSLSGDLSVQATHFQTPYPDQASYTLTPSAQMHYKNARLFNVSRLTFDSLLLLSEGNIAPTSSSMDQRNEVRSWRNDFTYLIGVLRTGLSTKIAKIGNTTASSIMFSLSRPF